MTWHQVCLYALSATSAVVTYELIGMYFSRRRRRHWDREITKWLEEHPHHFDLRSSKQTSE